MWQLVAEIGPRLEGVDAAQAEGMIRREFLEPVLRDLDAKVDLLEEQICAVQQ